LIHVTYDTNELNLLSSLDTFGYIEYDLPCDLNIVEKRMFCQTKLPLLTMITAVCLWCIEFTSV
jgi:hypothetical protein